MIKSAAWCLVAGMLALAGCGYLYGTTVSAIPFDKTYDQLTPEQKQQVRANYRNLPADLEPPFPEHGLIEITQSLDYWGNTSQVKGDVIVHVWVDAAGNPTRVQLDGDAQDASGRAKLTSLFMHLHYKPAERAGVPEDFVYYYSVSIR